MQIDFRTGPSIYTGFGAASGILINPREQLRKQRVHVPDIVIDLSTLDLTHIRLFTDHAVVCPFQLGIVHPADICLLFFNPNEIMGEFPSTPPSTAALYRLHEACRMADAGYSLNMLLFVRAALPAQSTIA